MNDLILWVACKINISVKDILGQFNRYYFTNLSRFWRHILWRHGFRTPVQIAHSAPIT